MASRTIGRRAFLAAASASVAGSAEPPAVKLTLDHGVCIVPVVLDGQAARFILDTGAERTILSHAAALRYRLKPDPWVATTLQGAGGRQERFANILVNVARLGNAALTQSNRGPLSLPVTSADLGGADGLLGGDILRHVTLDIDVPGRWFAVGASSHAPARALKLQALRQNLLLAPVALDGHILTALLDTGASQSLINNRGLYRLGLTQENLRHDQDTRIQAIGGGAPARLHRFRELRLAGQVFSAPYFNVIDVSAAAVDMVIGLDIIGQQRVVLSYPGLWLAFGGTE